MERARQRLWAAAVAAVGIGAGTAAMAAPTQAELADEVQALRAKVERLEAAQREKEQAATHPAPAAPAATGDDAKADVARDAASRSQLMQNAGNFTAGYNKGKFIIQDEKGDFLLHPQLQFMPRFAANFRDNARHGDEPDTDSGFEIRRLKLGFDGNVFSPRFTYLFLWATDRNTGNLVLEEAWGKQQFAKDFAVKAGQFKDPFAHESLTSSKKLLAAERTLINDVFTGGDNFVQGVSLTWDDGAKGSPFRAEIAYTDGANAANQNFQDFPVTKANFGVSGRVEYMAFGKWAEYEDFTALGNDQNLLVIGAGVDLTEAGNNDSLLHTVDVQYENRHLGLYAAYLGRSVEDQRVGSGSAATDVNTYDWGFIVQAAYALDEHLEPFVRYDYLELDEGGLASTVKQNQIHEVTAGLNYYFKSHNAKFTADFTWLPNGTPVAASGADILVSDDEDEFVIRAQFQLLL